MIRGTVVGQVWATRKSQGLSGHRLLLVAAPDDRLVVGVDTLDAGTGQEVLVSWGSGARNVLGPGPQNRGLLCDAAVSLVVDGAAVDSGGAVDPRPAVDSGGAVDPRPAVDSGGAVDPRPTEDAGMRSSTPKGDV